MVDPSCWVRFKRKFLTSGCSADRARKSIVVIGMLCMSAGLFAAAVHSVYAALTVIAVVLFGFQTWINNVQTMPSDWFPDSAVGSVAGLGGMGAGLGAMIFTQSTGFVVDHFSYTPMLVIAGALPLAGTAVLFLLGGPIRKLSFEKDLT